MPSRSTQLLALLGVGVAAAFAVAVAVLALGGGTSSASQADYTATVNNTRDRVDFALIRITRSGSEDELIERIAEASVVVGATAEDLDDAGVANGYEEMNDKLVETLRRFSNELAGTAAQFEDPYFRATLSGITSLGFQEWENVNKVLTDMQKKGLQVQLLERH